MPGRKDYIQKLPISFDLSADSIRGTPAEKAEGKAEAKFTKLRKNVTADLQKASEWLEINRAPARFFLDHPAMWGSELTQFTPEQLAWLRALPPTFPKFATSYRKAALDQLKRDLARQERKVAQAAQRLETLKPSPLPTAAEISGFPSSHYENR